MLAYEAFLTWLCQMAVQLAYMQNDSHDIAGVQGAAMKIQELLNSPAIKAITENRSSLKMFMLYF